MKKKIMKVIYCIIFVTLIIVAGSITVPNKEMESNVFFVSTADGDSTENNADVFLYPCEAADGWYCDRQGLIYGCPWGYDKTDRSKRGKESCYIELQCNEVVTSVRGQKSFCENGQQRDSLSEPGTQCTGSEPLYYGMKTSGCEKTKSSQSKKDTCDDLLDDDDSLFSKIRDNVLKPLRIIAPILLLVFTTMDFAKVVFSDNKDGMPKAWRNFLKRTIAVLIIFFSSNIVGIIYGFIQGVGFCWGDIFS